MKSKRPLGAGGMGEVYRAVDSRLGRIVAIKILPESFAKDAERVQRFEHEARLLSALNHPNLLIIFDVGSQDGIEYLVSEFLEGQTLREYLSHGALPQRRAIDCAMQIASGLSAAHNKGIIHRDLKPENIFVTRDERVKILDFGLAKQTRVTEAAAEGATLTGPMPTASGVILGTVGYMSPEQVRAQAADHRSDIFSFGAILYEMLSGKRAFRGDSSIETMNAILNAEPAEFSESGLPVNPGLERIVLRCLEKSPERRFQSASDLAFSLEALSGTSSRVAPTRPKNWSALAAAAAVIAIIATGVYAFLLNPQPAKERDWTADMMAGPPVSMDPRISPDGHTLAFQAMIGNVTQVAVLSPDTGNWTLLTHDHEHGFVNEITWAPEGSKLYYDRTVGVPAGIYSVPAIGGAERLVLDRAGCPEALPDGSLLIVRRETKSRWQIVHYWPDSQKLEPLSGWVDITTTIPLRAFPDGKEAVFLGAARETDSSVELYAMDIATGRTRRLAPQLLNRRNNESYPIATTADNRGILVDVAAGDSHRIAFVPRDGKGSIQTVMTLTQPLWYLDSAKDGTLYMDQLERPHEVVRFPVTGGTPEVLGSSETYVPAGQYMNPVQTTSGRFLLDTEYSSRGRLLVAKPGEDFLPLIDTKDETSSPATALGNDQVAFVLGSGSSATIVIASANEGRIVRWLQGTKGKSIISLAASTDSKTLYFGAEGSIWSIPTEDGSPRKIAVGENVSVDPNGRELVITQSVESNPILTRVSLDTGKTEHIHLEDGHFLAPVSSGNRAINRKGKMLITISPSDSWFYRVAVLDLAKGSITPIRVNYSGDTLSSNWTEDGRVISVGLRLRSQIWRFRPTIK